jgi:hypothetical protein
MVCECHLFNVDEENTHQYCCQTKVNDGEMSMKEYIEKCKDQKPDVLISQQEAERLFRNWNKKGIKYVVNEKSGLITFL